MNITRVSQYSGIERTIDLPITQEQIAAYEKGAHLQDAFSNLPQDLREFYLTGIIDEEWQELFPPVQEEEGQFHIHHATGPLKFTETKSQPRKYVGFVNATSLDEAFKKSQNLDEEWNPGVRSTSVGDVIQDDDKFYLVKGIGFEELKD